MLNAALQSGPLKTLDLPVAPSLHSDGDGNAAGLVTYLVSQVECARRFKVDIGRRPRAAAVVEVLFAHRRVSPRYIGVAAGST